jgi:microcin C transport system ATP-binding protein
MMWMCFAAMAHQVMVLNQGIVVEQGAAEQVLGDPQHEYTRTLVQAFPNLSLSQWASRGA